MTPGALIRGGAARDERALVWVEGPDAEGFLQGLLSNDVAGLRVGETAPALLLDARGHLQALLNVHRDAPQAFTLVSEGHLGEVLAETLERYHFSEELELLGPERAEAIVVSSGEGIDDSQADLILPGIIPGTIELIGDDAERMIASMGLRAVDTNDLEALRIRAGVPRIGVDTGAKTLVQEAGLEHLAVSFEKGCYLGQETVARAQFRGRVNRVPRLLEFDDPPPAVPAPVIHEGAQVGTLTSIASPTDGGPLGFAICRRSVEPGALVSAGDRTARVLPGRPGGAIEGEPTP